MGARITVSVGHHDGEPTVLMIGELDGAKVEFALRVEGARAYARMLDAAAQQVENMSRAVADMNAAEGVR